MDRAWIHASHLSIALAVMGCSVFKPPPADSDAGAGGANGSGGTGAPGGGEGGVHIDPDAGKGGASGSAGGGGKAGSAGGPTTDSGPQSTDPWWPTKNSINSNCTSAGMPTVNDRPKQSDPPDPKVVGGSVPPIYMALSFIRWGTENDFPALDPNPDAWQDIGFDMDGLCTNSSTCVDNRDKPIEQDGCKHVDGFVPRDGHACRDNQMGALYVLGSQSLASGQFGLTEDDTNCEIRRGGTSVIFKVSNYNGQLNDTSVRLDMYPSMGLQKQPSWSCRDKPNGILNPKWKTQGLWPFGSHWKIVSNSIDLSSDNGNDLPDSKVSDGNAYVRNGYLVAHFLPQSELYLATENTNISSFHFIMQRPLVMFQLYQNGSAWAFRSGIMQFAVKPNDLLQTYRNIGFCENLCGTYDQTKIYFNTYMDTLADGTNNPDTPCDALSAGIAIQGEAITANKGDLVVEPASQVATSTSSAVDPRSCPEPTNPDVPRQGCVCKGSTCIPPPDGGH